MQEAVARPEPIAEPAQPGAGLEAQHVTPYLAFLFLMLSTATLFDGFDSAMIGFAAPDVQATLGISTSQWGPVVTLTRLGVMASFMFVFFADRIGRRRVVMGTIVGFTLANFATAFVSTTSQFVMCQFVARLFLTAELSIAIIMVGEEFPARLRGRAIAILTSLATAGVIFISKLQPYVLLPPGAETNRVHDLGHGMVTGVQAALGLASDGAAWRSLYALGLLPLAAILLLRLGMRETRRFEAARASARSRRKATWGELWHDVTLPWHREYRRRTAIVALLWNCVYLVTGVSTAFYVIYARGTLKLTPFDVGDIVTWGYVGGIAGSFIGGWLIDRIGRKYTCAGAYVLGALSIYSLYHVTSVPAQYASMILTVLSFAGGLSATHVYASELFPTEIRATGYGWTANLAGRITEVFGPAVIGLFMAKLALSVPDAIAVLSVGPIVGALLVLRYAPETRGLTLEQIQQRLSA